MNVLLKRNISYEGNPEYNIGEFKTVSNIIRFVNIIKTTPPKDVEEELDALLVDYESHNVITLNEILDFHVRFERIYPFGSGNGCVGRMLMFKKCLKHDILPFIMLDQDKNFYLRGLKEYDRDAKFPVDTCQHSQDIYENICHQLLDFELEEGNEISLMQ